MDLKQELKNNSENTAKILELLQGKLGEKGLVHKVNETHETLVMHKSDLAEVKKDVSGLQKDRIKLVAIVSTIGALGSKGVEKLSALFGGSGQ